MFRKMRLIDQQLPETDTIELLKKNSDGTLSVIGDEGYPYGVPLNYAYDDGKLYFHCAKTGHKLDAVKKESKTCFTIIDAGDVKPEEFNTYYRSVIVFGKAHILTDEAEMKDALRVIIKKYSPDFMEGGEKYIDAMFAEVAVFVMDIEHMSGKQAEELF